MLAISDVISGVRWMLAFISSALTRLIILVIIITPPRLNPGLAPEALRAAKVRRQVLASMLLGNGQISPSLLADPVRFAERRPATEEDNLCQVPARTIPYRPRCLVDTNYLRP